MPTYEYKVVPAPTRGVKARGIKTPEARFANSVEQVLNQMGADGWEYQRAELLPSDERTGLTGSTTNWRNVLVFRRALGGDVSQFQPRVLDLPDDDGTEPGEPVGAFVPAPSVEPPATGEPPRLVATPERGLSDSEEKELRVVAGMTSLPKDPGRHKTGEGGVNDAEGEAGARKPSKD